MQIYQQTLSEPGTALSTDDFFGGEAPHLVFFFASPRFFPNTELVNALNQRWPQTQVVSCSTAGEIHQRGISVGGAVMTALRFSQPQFRVETVEYTGMTDSEAAGARLATALGTPELKGILVFAPGTAINGSALLRGMSAILPPEIPVSGGLAGDDGAFQHTWVGQETRVSAQQIVGIGFYGSGFRFSTGSFGGWKPFGIARRATRVDGNLLYELDHQPALEVYKRFLGDYAQGLPASGLLFPLAILDPESGEPGLVRTILGVNEDAGSLILAGELPANARVQLMHASTDGLVARAEHAAHQTESTLAAPALGLIVSCIGRRLDMGDRTEEEIEAVAEILGDGTTLTGFYSYGEISPYAASRTCELHNQTLTITLLEETAF